MSFLLLLVFVVTASSQQVYIPAQGSSSRPYCDAASTATRTRGSPSYYYSAFSYTQTETIRTATPATSAPAATYGASYNDVSSLFPNISTVSLGNWSPSGTATPTDTSDPYGSAAYTSLWDNFNPVSFTRGLYSTTASPTPVPSGELVLPPPLYFGPHDCYEFPEDFILGVAGSAAQVEGAVADEGRVPAVSEALSFGAALIGTVDYNYVTLENYYLYKQDITRIAAMGIKYYSFSISWARILPFVVPGSPVNSQALEHYDALINFALELGLAPIVTLLHADVPLSLFGNNYTEVLAERSFLSHFNFGYQTDGFQEAFINYGKIVMSHFADRVPIWITVNEPQSGAVSGPSVDNIIKSHAQLWHFYKEELKGTGKVSMKMGVTPGIPQNPANASHVEAVQHYNELMLGAYLDPLALGIDYPEVFKATIQDYIPLCSEDLEFLNGTLGKTCFPTPHAWLYLFHVLTLVSDFIGLDAYSFAAMYPIVSDINACAANNATTNTNYPSCVGSTEITENGWNMGYRQAYYMWSTPTYLRTGIDYLWNTYKVPVMITEFGFPAAAVAGQYLGEYGSTPEDALLDIPRSEYYLSYMSEVLKCIWEDGVDVMGALAWSWADNWEFGTFALEFGLQANDRTTQTRSYKRSFFDLVDFVETRRIKR